MLLALQSTVQNISFLFFIKLLLFRNSYEVIVLYVNNDNIRTDVSTIYKELFEITTQMHTIPYLVFSEHEQKQSFRISRNERFLNIFIIDNGTNLDILHMAAATNIFSKDHSLVYILENYSAEIGQSISAFFRKQINYRKIYFQTTDNRIVTEHLYVDDDDENIIKEEVISRENATTFIKTQVDPIKINMNRHNVTVFFKLMQPNSNMVGKDGDIYFIGLDGDTAELIIDHLNASPLIYTNVSFFVPNYRLWFPGNQYNRKIHKRILNRNLVTVFDYRQVTTYSMVFFFILNDH